MNNKKYLNRLFESDKPLIIYKATDGFDIFTDFSEKIKINSNNIKKFLKKISSKKRKYNKDQINIIRDIYKKTGIFTTTRKILSCEKQIDISIPTIKKIINNKY